jgi:hypothetical protein
MDSIHCYDHDHVTITGGGKGLSLPYWGTRLEKSATSHWADPNPTYLVRRVVNEMCFDRILFHFMVKEMIDKMIFYFVY